LAPAESPSKYGDDSVALGIRFLCLAGMFDGGKCLNNIDAIPCAMIATIFKQRADARLCKTQMINLFIVDIASTDNNLNGEKVSGKERNPAGVVVL
jgi:hypothetical protein